jgi:hypothetical protein
LEIKSFENEREEVLKSFEEELKNLELKYDKIMNDLHRKKNEKMQTKEVFSEYWIRVLTNNKMTKEFISEEDKPVLSHLKNLTSIKLEDGNVNTKILNIKIFYRVSN